MSVTWPVMIRKVQGHSMVPVLPPGTLVFGLKWFRTVRPGKVIIFTQENRETVKRVDHVQPDGLYVLGDHPETSTDSRHYGPIESSTVSSIVVWPRTAKVAADSAQNELASRLKPRRKDS